MSGFGWNFGFQKNLKVLMCKDILLWEPGHCQQIGRRVIKLSLPPLRNPILSWMGLALNNSGQILRINC